MHQIFLRLEENGVSTYNELVEAAAEYNFSYDFLPDSDELEELSAQNIALSSRLEGFLYPDTYEFYVGMQASSAISKLLDTFNRRFSDDMRQQAENIGLTIPDVVKVASLIEKEAANDEERPIIASVIYNRLNAGMYLGIDSTVLYPYPEHEGAPTGTMLETDGPYNSRMRLGLPPTAICSPGYMSINSALYPESTNYFYYALDTETGKHRFFTNSTEFDSFVATQNYE